MALRRDGPGGRRFAGYGTWEPAPPPVPQKPIVRAAPRTSKREPRNEVQPEVEPIGKVPAEWPTEVTDAVRAEVHRRSRGRCEARLDGCERWAVHVHHRKLRRHRDHRAVNLLDVCLACHDWIHHNVAWAQDWGWLLKSTWAPDLVAAGVYDPDRRTTVGDAPGGAPPTVQDPSPKERLGSEP